MSAESSRALARIVGTALMIAVFGSFAPAMALAGGFYVVPTVLELNKGAKSGSFSVVNNGDEKLDFKITVLAWTQGTDGKDVYEETPEIVFFPRIMTVEGHDQRPIRIGVKGTPPVREKAYRLFVEEIPRPGTGAVSRFEQGNVSAAIAFAYRFSIPIFWRPLKVQGGGVMQKVEMNRGEMRAVVSNTGSAYLKIPAVTFRGLGGDGSELFSHEMNGWYILNGVSRTYAFTVPRDICGSLATIDVKARTNQGELVGILNVQKGMCAP